MDEQQKSIDKLLSNLQERAKELECLYDIEELINEAAGDSDLDKLFQGVANVIPHGWQHPDKCCAKISYGDSVYTSVGFQQSPWEMRAAISVQIEVVGMVHVFYTEQMPVADEGPFLKEERKLLNTIADRLGHFILHQNMNRVLKRERPAKPKKKSGGSSWNCWSAPTPSC